MIDNKREAIWSWNYNYGKAYPMPCDRCGELIEMTIITHGNPKKYVKCPECGYMKKTR